MIYKIQQQDIAGLSAEIVEKLDGIINICAYESYSYILSNQELPTPFVEVDEMPSEVKEAFDALLNEEKKSIIEKAIEATQKITTLTSSVLGTPHIYDFEEQDQINLTQAREYISLMGDVEVGIRCTNQDGIKDNFLHTRDQVNLLFEEWYQKKSLILNTYSTFKILINSQTNFDELQSIQDQYNETIERIING